MVPDPKTEGLAAGHWVFVPVLQHARFLDRKEELANRITAELRVLPAALTLDLDGWRRLMTWSKASLEPINVELATTPLAEAHGRKALAEAERRRQAVATLDGAGRRVLPPEPAPPLVGREELLGELTRLLDGRNRRSVLLVGDEAAGKSALASAWATTHPARMVWATSASELVAGASGLGEWQARVSAVLAAAETLDAILYFDDFGALFADLPAEGGIELGAAMRRHITDGRVRVVGELTAVALDRAERRRGRLSDSQESRSLPSVWRITGKRLIAGMSYLGQWEERCLAVLDDARKRRGILWIEDLHLFGRLGQSRQSESSFADFFRGPVRRGDLAVIAELTPAQFARLKRDAPGLAEALALVSVPAASAVETSQLLLHEIRALETRTQVELHPFVPRTALELGRALFPWRARPGVAIEIVQRVAHDAATRQGEARKEIGPSDVLDYLARATGLSAKLISLDEPLDPAEVEAAFAARVIGQPDATRAATDVILRVRAGLSDPNRPVSVMLFTGPTGTGKTELATGIAEYLYGAGERLLRIDMGELSGPDAVARLIGDRWNLDGLLTSRVHAQPFCVVLLDEIEKAHPQALHLLLQLFDEGRLTDAKSEVASFASAVVIMTSNLGSRNAAPIGFGETRDRILADVAKAAGAARPPRAQHVRVCGRGGAAPRGRGRV